MVLDIKSILRETIKPQLINEVVEDELQVGKEYKLVGKDGVYSVMSNGVMYYKHLTNKFTEKDEIFEEVNEGMKLLVPKIPFKYYMMVGDYFRDVYKRDGTEAGILFYYKNDKTDMEWLKENGGEGLIVDGDLIVYCPYQHNTGAIHRIGGEKVYEYLRENAYPMCWVHSHHTMGISWSATDDANMKAFEFSSVFRHIYRFEDTLTRIHYKGKYIDIDTKEVFSIPQILLGDIKYGQDINTMSALDMKGNVLEYLDEIRKEFEELEEYPKQWMDRTLSKKEEPYFSKETVEEDRFSKIDFSKLTEEDAFVEGGYKNSLRNKRRSFEDRLAYKSPVNKRKVGNNSMPKTFKGFDELAEYKESIKQNLEDNAVQEVYDYYEDSGTYLEDSSVMYDNDYEGLGIDNDLEEVLNQRYHSVDVKITTDEGYTVRDVEVELYDDLNNLIDTDKTDINGNVAFEDIEDGGYTISLKDYDYEEDIQVTSNHEKEIILTDKELGVIDTLNELEEVEDKYQGDYEVSKPKTMFDKIFNKK